MSVLEPYRCGCFLAPRYSENLDFRKSRAPRDQRQMDSTNMGMERERALDNRCYCLCSEHKDWAKSDSAFGRLLCWSCFVPLAVLCRHARHPYHWIRSGMPPSQRERFLIFATRWRARVEQGSLNEEFHSTSAE